MRVLHLIPDLDQGGAEKSLIRLTAALPEDDTSILCLKDRGVLADEAEAAGATVISLGMRPGRLDPASVPRLIRTARSMRPDVIHAWMYHACTLSTVLRPLRRPLVWGLRHGSYDGSDHTQATNLTFRTAARLSGVIPHAIVFPSQPGLEAHVDVGYPRRRCRVIPNGVDPTLQGDVADAERLRAELGIKPDQAVIGHVGRFAPEKDHRSMLLAAEQVCAAVPDAQIVLLGRDIDLANDRLTRLIPPAIRGQVHLLGYRDDVPTVLRAMDVLVVSSRTESFPNVIVEAMACGIPVVSTDVGDARRILGPSGSIVSPSSPAELARATLDVLDLDPTERLRRRNTARARVEREYTMTAVANAHRTLYRGLLRAG